MNYVEIATSYGSKLHDEAMCDNLSETKYGLAYKEIATPEKDEIGQKSNKQYIAMGF